MASNKGLLDHGAIMKAMKETEEMEKLAKQKREERKALRKLPWTEEEIEKLLLAEQMYPKKEKGSDDEYESDDTEGTNRYYD